MPEIEDVLRSYVERIWNAHDVGALWDFVSGDYVLAESPQATPVKGPEGLAEYVRAMLTAFPDHRLEIVDLLIDGDRVAWDWRMTGTHRGAFLGVAATGRAVSMTGIAIYQIVDGLIVARRGEADVLELLFQIGAVPMGSLMPEGATT